MFINLLKFETSKFIDSASVFFKNISVYYLRRDVFLDVRYMEEKIMRKGDKETEKPLHFVLYRSLLGC